jgi:general secretion pathway protein G
MKRMKLKLGGGDAGFTLIEIMVVVVILGILAAVVVPIVLDRPQKAKVERTKLDIQSIETALGLFKLDNGFYPSTEQGLEALVNEPTSGRIPKNWKEGGYLKSRPLDPWGNPYAYLSPGSHGPFDIISYGADEVEGGEDYDKDITNWVEQLEE